MDFEKKLFLKQEEDRLLATYGFDNLEEVLEYLRYEKQQLLKKLMKQKNESSQRRGTRV